MLEATSARFGSVASDLGWSAGLVVAGVVLAVVTAAFVWDYREMSSRYFQSTVEAGSQIFFLGSRYERLKFKHFRFIVGTIGWVFASLLFLLGIYGFVVA
jgi:hypothetical protein